MTIQYQKIDPTEKLKQLNATRAVKARMDEFYSDLDVKQSVILKARDPKYAKAHTEATKRKAEMSKRRTARDKAVAPADMPEVDEAFEAEKAAFLSTRQEDLEGQHFSHAQILADLAGFYPDADADALKAHKAQHEGDLAQLEAAIEAVKGQS